ncbi:MAG: hypothetical protein KF850_05735 [Labilithrix sp.]|nr:hypothetical protein [Labilithrix sp.]
MGRTRFVAGVAILTALGGCDAEAGKAEIFAFRARVTTGAEGSDGDVHLCWTAGETEECKELASDDDDWQAGASRVYEVRPKARIPEATPLTDIRLKYTAPIFVGRDEWELAGVTVTAYLANDTSKVVCDARELAVVMVPPGTFDCPPVP